MTTSRRVALGATWAVPVIAFGAAAPAASASPLPPVIVQAQGLGCKEPGKSFSKDFPYGYRLFLRANASAVTSITLTGCTVPSGAAAVGFVSSVHALVPGDNDVEVFVGSTNSANGTAVLQFTWEGQIILVSVEFGDGFHPCER